MKKSMKCGLLLGTFVCMLWTASSFGQGNQVNAAGPMPNTDAETLSGRHLVLSAALTGHASALVMGFSKDAGDPCTDWARALRGDAALAGLQVYEAAMLAGAPGFVRGMIKSGMRKGVSAAEQETFVVLVQDEQAWRGYFGVKDDKQPYVVVLDAQGKVRWLGGGLAKDLEVQVRAAAK